MAMKSLWQAVRGRAAWFLLCVAAMALRASAASSRHCTAQHYVRISSDACMSALAVDQVQLLGAHNTYHQVPTSRSFLQTIMQGLVIDGFLTSGDQAIAQAFARRLSLNYNNYTDILSTHGISAVEIDLWKDTQGGRFRYAALKKLIGATSGVSGDLGAAMSVPGYKVMHNIDVDYGTSCQTFVDCLGAINATLSSAKYPIFLHMEYKSSQSNTGPFLDASFGAGTSTKVNAQLAQIPGEPTALATAEAAASTDWSDIQTTILSQIPRSMIVAPSDITVVNSTVSWPSLKDVAGKIFLLGQGEYTDQITALGASRVIHRYWTLGSTTDTATLLNTNSTTPAPATQDMLFLEAPGTDAATQALIPKFVAQRQIVTGLGAFMDKAYASMNKTQSVSDTLTSANSYISTYGALGTHVIKTDFLVDQSVQLSVNDKNGAPLISAETFGTVGFNTTGTVGGVMQCNSVTAPKSAKDMGCCVPDTIQCSGAMAWRVGTPLLALAAVLAVLLAA